MAQKKVSMSSGSIAVPTTRKTEVINVTRVLAEVVSNYKSGIALFSVPHTTAALILSEDDEELRGDILKVAESLFADMRPFKHIRENNPNAEAHLFSALAGTSVVLGVQEGQLELGTYQNVLLIELDGPKTREIRCTFVTKV